MMNTHYLFPGKLAAFKEETVISTLLGSCVAVAIYDPSTKIGGLNHYLLPEGLPEESRNSRYASFAIPQLIEECVRLGANRGKMQAKIYGGGNVISVSQLGDGIGKRNIEIAEQLLREFNIPIVERNVAGESARTIKMNTSTFEVIHNSPRDTGSVDKPVDVSGFKPLSVARNVKVLVVDDSATVRTLFTNIFTKSGLEVVGSAADPYQAREMILSKKPDVVTLDIEMPKMSGVMFLEKLMKHHPIPVVMVSSLASTGEAALKSLELGAVEFVHKPSQFDPAVLKDLAAMLVDKVRAAASVNVLKRLKDLPPVIDTKATTPMKMSVRRSAELKVVVLGGNAGSADAVEKFVKNLAADTPPVVVACSTVANFATAFISKLKQGSKVTPVLAKDGEFLRMGHVYFIPAEHHGKLQTGVSGPVLNIQKGAPVASQLPSANVLFQSAAAAYNKGVYAVLLGGFGGDGVEGLTEVQKKGGATVVQHPEEAQFPYAPQKAIELGVADEILKSDMLAHHLMQYRNQNLY
ncbi:MAG: chemotaxis protein CheB [Bdellovibrio sp. ArHS]|uniref:chemotaxis protein CheB n=1 Tax=Bdellovibrio sp. ArHS TaxID=1569284 RepID=UPI000582D5A2|nr:chemotaxis protein CheB [Bdellovibrio sp. ArHS]KHD89719.1 MAG: chemotaxis protein CheB [Bdellovibrio sp. ArHS]